MNFGYVFALIKLVFVCKKKKIFCQQMDIRFTVIQGNMLKYIMANGVAVPKPDGRHQRSQEYLKKVSSKILRVKNDGH